MKGVLFHQDNAPLNKSVVAMAAMPDCGFELVDQPPYSPDLAPSDYFLPPTWKKKHLAGKQYQTNDEVISAQLRTFFGDQVENFYTTGITGVDFFAVLLLLGDDLFIIIPQLRSNRHPWQESKH